MLVNSYYTSRGVLDLARTNLLREPLQYIEIANIALNFGQAITASRQRKNTPTEFICYSFVVGDGCFIPSAFDTISVYTYPS